MTYEIILPQFEGPFDLLLFFIERDELNIYDISISKITDDFLHYIHQRNQLNMEVAGDFILTAASLMRIKAKMLLPRPELDDKGNEIDPRAQLIEKLIAYKKFKAIVPQLEKLEIERLLQEKRGHIAADLAQLSKEVKSPEMMVNLTLYHLVRAYKKALFREAPTASLFPAGEMPTFSVERQKDVILDLVKMNAQLNFNLLLTQSRSKLEVIYNLMAILELLQQQLLHIEKGLGFNNFWLQQNN